ncbi:MAG: hypothetical protein A2W03_09630 [Candidatus Aminicenantes bacterium RBG_16_63_16]|nr:MAG: hypothetical protein A2W03_09630 [Candidatus Aminicenantes bacterium RBG_16_63_16]
MKINKNSLLIYGFLALAALVVAVMPACKKGTESEQITLDTVAAVMGTPSGSSSGVSELAKEGDTYIINYHLMISDMKDFDVIIGSDLAPKIAALYKTFKSLDKATFTVETGDPSNPANVNPYCDFDMTRKIYQQLNWTNLLARDLFKVCKVTYK